MLLHQVPLRGFLLSFECGKGLAIGGQTGNAGAVSCFVYCFVALVPTYSTLLFVCPHAPGVSVSSPVLALAEPGPVPPGFPCLLLLVLLSWVSCLLLQVERLPMSF